MADAQVFVFLLLAVAVLAGLGLRSGVPYPVALVLGGLAIGLTPGLPSPALDPDVVFFAFLPPLVYSAAFTASAYELRAYARPILTLATGLVLLTMVAVAAAVHFAAGIPWAPAFVLGAVLGPTDPVSASAVMQRVGASTRLETILEGESLINDGTGLTAYKLAVAVAVGGDAGSAGGIALHFVAVAAGGIAIGLAVAWAFGRIRSFVNDPSLDVTLSVVTPFAAYVPAERVHASGVLAVVAAGVYIGARSLDLVEASNRLRTTSFWESAAFLLNGLLFVLIGVEVPHIVSGIAGADVLSLAGHALLVTAVVVGVRMAWTLVVPAVSPFGRDDRTPVAERIVLGWSGMRGGVSLAAALAIPLSAGAAPFPDRDRIIFLAYAAVVLTLVVPGLTLAPLLRALGLGESETHRRAAADARLRVTHAGLERLEQLAADDGAPETSVARLRDRYEARLRRLEARADAAGHDDEREVHLRQTARLQAEMIAAERDVLRRMRRERAFPADVLRDLERELDLDESRLHARS
jgi:Na+/H+ antiporter